MKVIVLNILAAFLLANATFAGGLDMLRERVHETELPNGLKVVVVERHNAPVFYGMLTFRVGSNNEQPNHTGLSHFLEHMLFKGSESLGTTDREKEIPLMEELEVIAEKIKAQKIALQHWRYELFEAYTLEVKTNLSDEIRESVGADQGAGWRAALNVLPEDHDGLPEEWSRTQSILSDQGQDYWSLYRQLLANRARLDELLEEHRQYIESEPLEVIYNQHGAQDFNAWTSNDQTNFCIGLPANCLELWMYLEADQFMHPVFREFYSERDVILEEAGLDVNDPDEQLWEALYGTVFTAHPRGRPILGWTSDIELTLRTDMEAHFQKYYAPNNCQITVVGDVDADEVFSFAETYFGDWQAHPVDSRITVIEPEQKGMRRAQVEFDAEPSLLLGFRTPVPPHPDAYVLTIIVSILSGGRSSRFYRSIFEAQGLTISSPWAGNPEGRDVDVLLIGAEPKAPHTADEVERAILAELERLKTEPVTEWELERVRNAIRMSRIQWLTSNEWLAVVIADGFALRGNWKILFEDYNRMLAVTAEDVMRVANKYFRENNLTEAVLVPTMDETPVDSE